MPGRRLVLLRLAATLLACGATVAGAQPGVPAGALPAAVKAAFLYKFGSFVEWPPEAFPHPAEPLAIGVLGDEAIADELEQITRGRQVEGRPVRVVRLRESAAGARLHIFFIGAGRNGRARELFDAAPGPVLTVADGPGAGRTGAVLHFLEMDGRMRFGASLTAAQARNLRLSARLLAVAQTVEGRTP